MIHLFVCLCVCVLSRVQLCHLMNCSPPGSFCLWNSPGKNTGGGCHALLQGIFPTQESNPHLLLWHVGSLPVVPLGKLYIYSWEAVYIYIHTPTHIHIYVYMGFSGGSDSKESACNAGDLGLIPGSGRAPGKRNGYSCQYSWGFLVAQMVKESACNVGDPGLIPGSERCPGEGDG